MKARTEKDYIAYDSVDFFIISMIDEMGRLTLPDWVVKHFHGAVGLVLVNDTLKFALETDIDEASDSEWICPIDKRNRIVIPKSYCINYDLYNQQTVMLERKPDGLFYLSNYSANHIILYDDLFTKKEINEFAIQGLQLTRLVRDVISSNCKKYTSNRYLEATTQQFAFVSTMIVYETLMGLEEEDWDELVDKILPVAKITARKYREIIEMTNPEGGNT